MFESKEPSSESTKILQLNPKLQIFSTIGFPFLFILEESYFNDNKLFIAFHLFECRLKYCFIVDNFAFRINSKSDKLMSLSNNLLKKLNTKAKQNKQTRNKKQISKALKNYLIDHFLFQENIYFTKANFISAKQNTFFTHGNFAFFVKEA